MFEYYNGGKFGISQSHIIRELNKFKKISIYVDN